MTGMQRVLATLAGQSVDRRAFCPVLSLYGVRLLQTPLSRYYTDPAEYARGQSAIRERFQPDVLLAPFAFALIGAAFGAELQWYGNQAPVIKRPSISSINELAAVVPPDIDTHPNLQYIREAVRLMKAEHRDDVVIAAPLPPPIDLPNLVMGIDAWMDMVLFSREKAMSVMEVMIDFIVRFANSLLEAGATLIVLPCAFASPAIVSRDVAEEFARPALCRTFEKFKGPAVLHHGGAPLLDHLDLLRDIPNVVGVVIDQDDDLDLAREALGPDPIILSGINAPSMESLTAAHIEHACLEILQNRRDDPRFIFATCGPDIPYTTSEENIHALRNAIASGARFVP